MGLWSFAKDAGKKLKDSTFKWTETKYALQALVRSARPFVRRSFLRLLT